ncbi:MAG: cation transporter, partial [Solobacterium sp.]|nr:cation transporter [Solobacterium sp.]
MSELALYRYELTGIDCADCAAKLEAKLKQIEGISDVSLSFLHSSLTYVCDHGKGGETEAKVRAVIREEEPDAVLKAKGHSHLHTAENHEHEHEHEEHCGCHAHEADHEERALYRYELTGIDCADCAAKLEAKLKQIEGISDVSLSFLHSSLTYVCDHDKGGETEAKVRAVIREEEPDAVLKAKGHSHLHTAERDENEHQHEHERSESACGNGSCRLSVTGIDCADCADSLERKIARLNGISNVRLSFMNSTLTYDCEDPAAAERAIRELVAKEEPDATVSAYEQSAVSESQADSGKKADVMLVRLIIGGILFLAGLFTEGTLQTALEITSYLVLGYDVLLRAVKGIGRGQVFDEHFLMSVATLAAMYLKDFREAAGVMLFYQIGEYFQDRAVASSRRSIAELMDIRPDTATVK